LSTWSLRMRLPFGISRYWRSVRDIWISQTFVGSTSPSFLLGLGDILISNNKCSIVYLSLSLQTCLMFGWLSINFWNSEEKKLITNVHYFHRFDKNVYLLPGPNLNPSLKTFNQINHIHCSENSIISQIENIIRSCSKLHQDSLLMENVQNYRPRLGLKEHRQSK
jgi:hypothetical protein